MDLFLAIECLIGGFVLLIKGADMFVDGSSNIAKLLKVPTIIIGLTVVAFGTSMPEASVSISSALKGANELAVSNVVGSNMFNTLVVLGACALIKPVKTQINSVKKEIPFSILCTVALFAALLFGQNVITKTVDSVEVTEKVFTLGLAGGIVLLALFAFYMFWQIKDALKARKAGELVEEESCCETISPLKSIFFIAMGVAGIIFGGDLVVEGASVIAAEFGMSQTFIGLTVVAVGTSLPELVTSLVAAKKGESDLAIGNAIGSNIFNIIFILGFSSVISPITVEMDAIWDTAAVIAVSVICLIFAATKLKISRIEGGIMLLIYAAYLVYILLRALPAV